MHSRVKGEQMRGYLAFTLCALAGLISACAIQTTSSTPSVDQMERAWSEQTIAAYRIEVLVVRSVWHAQSHQITVRDNQVESATASCIPAPTEAGKCRVEAFNAEEYTVPGLFLVVPRNASHKRALH
jgi:hypothetical protein